MFLKTTATNIAPTYPGKESPVALENHSLAIDPIVIHTVITAI